MKDQLKIIGYTVLVGINAFMKKIGKYTNQFVKLGRKEKKIAIIKSLQYITTNPKGFAISGLKAL